MLGNQIIWGLLHTRIERGLHEKTIHYCSSGCANGARLDQRC